MRRRRTSIAIGLALVVPLLAACRAPEPPPLDYVERIVGDPAPGDLLPLIVGFHGLGDDPERFSQIVGDLPVPARLVFPRAPDPYGSGSSWFAFSRGDPERLAEGIRAAGERAAALLERLQAEQPARGQAIVFGFSQGGILAFYLAAAHPELVHTAIPISGLLPDSLLPQAASDPVSLQAFHGSTDALVPIDGARRAVSRFRAEGQAAELHEYPGVPHAISRAMHRDIERALVAAVRAQEAAPPLSLPRPEAWRSP